jgi:hypothetical protein
MRTVGGDAMTDEMTDNEIKVLIFSLRRVLNWFREFDRPDFPPRMVLARDTALVLEEKLEKVLSTRTGSSQP